MTLGNTFNIIIFSVFAMLAQPVIAGDVSGNVKIVDGDTLKVGDVRIRLHAIDAPENDQTCKTELGTGWACGAWVTGEVRRQYEGRRATCQAMDLDRYGRVVARCFVDGKDLGKTLVSEGLAFAYVKYGDDYAEAEARAAQIDRGLHAMRLRSPAQHRITRVKGRIPPDRACNIKGNIGSTGTWIYHTPGQQFYERTGIRPDKGERWFCSEAAAVSAGWRRAWR